MMDQSLYLVVLIGKYYCTSSYSYTWSWS